MTRRVVICVDTLASTLAAARLVDGVLDDLFLDPPSGRARPGAVFRAKLARPLKGQGAWIIDLPHGLSGYLRGGGGRRAGASITVQVTGFPEDGKAVPVTDRLLFKSRHAIATPDAPGVNVARAITDASRRQHLQVLALSAHRSVADPSGKTGLIVRSAAGQADDMAICEDITQVCESAARVAGAADGAPALLIDGPDPGTRAWQEWADAPSIDGRDTGGTFAERGILEQLDVYRRAVEPLDGGAHMAVETTRACVAVDVNTGAEPGISAGLRANLSAARRLPRSLRIRGLGGQIVVDFAPMSKRDRPRILQSLEGALRSDPVETAIAGWTNLGHLEITRKRERVPLADVLR